DHRVARGIAYADRAGQWIEACESARVEHAVEILCDELPARLVGRREERERAVQYEELLGAQHDLEARDRLLRQELLTDLDRRFGAACDAAEQHERREQ